MTDTVAPPIRRVVTSVTGDGVGIVSLEGAANFFEPPLPAGVVRPRFHLTWQTGSTPSDAQVSGDGALLDKGGQIGNQNGSVLQFADWPPGYSSRMHRTPTVDYGIVLKGEIVCELDDGSKISLKENDCIVQRSTEHAWHNPTDKWTRMVFVILPADPIFVNGVELPVKNV